MNLTSSSIWDSETGFGGDGNPNGEIIVGNGRCVIDGPFTELRPIMYNHTYVTHCLARGFRDVDQVGKPLGQSFAPESIGEIMRMPTYQTFTSAIERNLHNTMHMTVSGDFLALTAANGQSFDYAS